MFKQITIIFRQSYTSSVLNGNSMQPDYYALGHDHAFVPSALKFKFFVNSHPFHYYRNVLPNWNRNVYLNYNALIYPSSYEQDYLALYTQIPSKLIFGYELPDKVNFAYYDTQNQKLYTIVKTTDFIPGNDGVLCTYDDNTQIIDSTPLTLLFNGIIIQRLIPYYEKLLNPFLSTFYSAYSFLKENGSYNLRPPTYLPDNVPDHYIIYLPKYMLVVNGEYYTIANGNFQKFIPQASLVTLDELNKNGFELDTLNILDKSVWESVFDLANDEFSILTNGYVTPSIILGQYWLDKYNYDRFIWTIPGKQKTLILTGDI